MDGRLFRHFFSGSAQAERILDGFANASLRASQLFQHIERSIDGRKPDGAAAAIIEDMAPMDNRPVPAACRQMYETDRFVTCPAAWPGDPGDRDGQTCRCPVQQACCHGPCDRFADRSVALNQVWRHAKHVDLGFVGIGDEPAIHDIG